MRRQRCCPFGVKLNDEIDQWCHAFRRLKSRATTSDDNGRQLVINGNKRTGTHSRPSMVGRFMLDSPPSGIEATARPVKVSDLSLH